MYFYYLKQLVTFVTKVLIFTYLNRRKKKNILQSYFFSINKALCYNFLKLITDALKMCIFTTYYKNS